MILPDVGPAPRDKLGALSPSNGPAAGPSHYTNGLARDGGPAGTRHADERQPCRKTWTCGGACLGGGFGFIDRMQHYDFTEKFRAHYDQTVARYAAGQRGAETFFTAGEKVWLGEHGLTAQNLYDYAEDQVTQGEPGYDRALAIELVRRDYFLNVQQGRPSRALLDEAKLPGKTEAVQGIAWLPRIIPKTKAKLRGELPASLMYCCGGDRRFFKEHDLEPSEFLHLIWRHENDDHAIVAWVVQRSKARR